MTTTTATTGTTVTTTTDGYPPAWREMVTAAIWRGRLTGRKRQVYGVRGRHGWVYLCRPLPYLPIGELEEDPT